MSILIEDNLPNIQENGLNTNKNVAMGGNLSVAGDVAITGDISVDDITIDALTTTGNTILGNATSDTTTVNGVLTVTSAATAVGVTTAGGVATKSGTAVPASAGAVAAGPAATFFTSGPSIYVTSDAPAFSAVKGSLCINTAGSGVGDRLYINNGTTNWVAITTAS